MIIESTSKKIRTPRLQPNCGTRIKQIAGPVRAIVSNIFRDHVSEINFFWPTLSEMIPNDVKEMLKAT